MSAATFADFNFSATFDHFRGGPRDLDDIRLLVVDARKGSIEHDSVVNLGRYLSDEDTLAVNDVGIGPSRLQGHAESGQDIDVCFLMAVGSNARWEAVVLSEGEPPQSGTFILGGGRVRGVFLEKTQDFDGSYWIEKDRYMGYRGVIELTRGAEDLRATLGDIGLLMHPWYVDLNQMEAPEVNPGNIRHSDAVLVSEPARRITPDQWRAFEQRGIDVLPFSLWMSFSWRQARPSTMLFDYRMNQERLIVSAQSGALLDRAVTRRSRIVCVGTSGARALESLDVGMRSYDGVTDLFLSPGHRFKHCSSLLTNLHNPMGTHVIMACAFGGRDLVMEACEYAAREGMRFGIHGDLMLVHGAHEPLAWTND